MPMPTDRVELLIGGNAQSDWVSCEIDSDLLVPADGFHMQLGANNPLPSYVKIGAPVQVKIGNDLVLTGRIDDIAHPVGKGAHSISISGRDNAAALVDCSVPIFAAKMMGLPQVVAKIVSSFGIKQPSILADQTTLRDKINVEPGDTAWDMLARVCEANGLWPWFDPDGTLVIGGPDYSEPEVATLILRRRENARDNNVLSLEKHESARGRYSELTVLGQTHGTGVNHGHNDLSAKESDPGIGWFRPKLVMDHECDSTEICRMRARKLIADGRLNGMTLTASVKGHRIVAPGQAADGLLWTPGQRVHVISEPHGIDAAFFVMGRRFTRDRMSGTRTALTLKEDGVWLVDAHPHKNQHRRGKNTVAPIDIVVPGSRP